MRNPFDALTSNFVDVHKFRAYTLTIYLYTPGEIRFHVAKITFAKRQNTCVIIRCFANAEKNGAFQIKVFRTRFR